MEGRGDGGEHVVQTTAMAVGMVTATAMLVAGKEGGVRRDRKSLTAQSCRARIRMVLSVRY